jgi:ankyrin repeat protein
MELIESGLDVNFRDDTSLSPLHYAVSAQMLDVTELLLEAGADIEAKDVHGNTPLSDAVFYANGRPEIIELFLKKGANPDAENNHAVSPRSLALSIGNYDYSDIFGEQ